MKKLKILIMVFIFFGFLWHINTVMAVEELRCESVYKNAEFRAANLYPAYAAFCLYINKDGEFSNYSILGRNFRQVSGPWQKNGSAWECSARWGGTAEACVFARDTIESLKSEIR